MRISDFLSRDFIVLGLEAKDMEGVLREVSAKAASAGLGAESVIAERLLVRERAHCTVVGSGIAIPHATIPDLAGPVIGIAVAHTPIQFGPTDNEPVSVFFVLLSPPGQEREHVKLLARICRLGRHEDLVARLGGEVDHEGIARAVEAIDAEHV